LKTNNLPYLTHSDVWLAQEVEVGKTQSPPHHSPIMNVPQSITTSSGGRSDSVVTAAAATGGVGEAITSAGSLSLLNSYTSIASSSSITSSASSLTSASTTATATAMTVSASTSALQNSSKYRAYAQAVDKALKSFENTTEWADLIAALGKLGKVGCMRRGGILKVPVLTPPF
jgi:hypothetical protein